MLSLPVIFTAASVLVDSTDPGTSRANLEDILKSRLRKCSEILGEQWRPAEIGPVKGSQVETAYTSLRIIELVQDTLGRITRATSSIQPAEIGSRDLAQLRTLISIVFRWGVEPSISHLASRIQHKESSENLIYSTEDASYVDNLYSIVSRVLAFLFPPDSGERLNQSVISVAIIEHHLKEVLCSCLVLSLPGTSDPKVLSEIAVIKTLLEKLLYGLSSDQVVGALGRVLSDYPSLPLYARRNCGYYLSKQVLRPDGILGLCSAILGDENEASLDKIEHIARVLSVPPADMKPIEYFKVTVPRIISILRAAVPNSYRQAAAFSITRMMGVQSPNKKPPLASLVVLRTLQEPFILEPKSSQELQKDRESHLGSSAASGLTPSKSLASLIALLLNTDPSPTLISRLLSSIFASLYTLYSTMEDIKTSDPTIKEQLRGLLTTWGRAVNAKEGVQSLWSIIEGKGGFWEIDLEGQFMRVEKPRDDSSLALFTPESVRKAEAEGDFDLNGNPFDLRPNPSRFVGYLKSIDRSDVASEIFIKLLESYRECKNSAEVEPLRELIYLQLIIQMQTQLFDSGTSNILKNPQQIILFIQHVLQSARDGPVADASWQKLESSSRDGVGLRFIPQDEDRELLSNEDSDDEQDGSIEDGMTTTAVELLLSILEANPDLSARTAPLLNEIFVLLEPIAGDPKHTARLLAREARIVMTARLASSSAPGKTKDKKTKVAARETYQKALKLLQDPILPVRAHGLLLLRQLVSSHPGSAEPVPDPALIPAVLSIFLQCIQDDDSYIFLNSVQGLAAMTTTYGKEVLRELVSHYTQGLDNAGGTRVSQANLDKKVRIGEALGQVIRRYGTALRFYAEILVPPLFAVVRAFHLPTALRSSSLSLLAACEEVDSVSLLPYIADLVEAMIDLIQVESPKLTGQPDLKGKANQKFVEADTGIQETKEIKPKDALDSDPTSTDPKIPPLRRSALHFLAVLFRAGAAHPDFDIKGISGQQLKRAKVTLAYVSGTDEDRIARVMAREAGEEIKDFERRLLGI